ncbi:hypothetical protein RTG_00993 [Rhodotorula toruloides ATCC 204091]|uniref:Uncharacterized protein n=1 Tax=Rhodotorula toruloides TaxID=5286 RepID=A0A0K3CBG1_RHOTO|nr:hypothetical protein RTG_00993 [Rhodotorula toruloides ATCC 204091]
MSSYLNAQPPPPPPPKSSSAETTPPPPAPSSSLNVPSTARKGHKPQTSVHYNDFPELDFSPNRAPSKRGRVNPRLAAALPSTASTATPDAQNALPSPSLAPPATAAPDTILPAFNAPPAPGPEPTMSVRMGPSTEDARFPADLLRFERIAADKPARLFILFIPGNPGLVSYYRDFLTSLRDALPLDLRDYTEMAALGHLRHTPGYKEEQGYRPQDQATLDEQVDAKISFVEELAREYKLGQEGSPKLVILGHSIGSWIGMQVLKRVPQHVFALHMLFPTISHMAQTPNGKRLSPLFSSWALRPVFYSTSALSYLPTGLSSRLVSLLTGQSGSGAQTTTQLVSSPETVVAALVMARNELAQVTELDREALREHGGKVWIYWAAEGIDGMSPKHVELTNNSSAAHTTSLARKCAGWIVEDVVAQQDSQKE